MQLKYTDRWHAYYLDGVRCKSVTTVAKIPDDTYNLEQWGKRQVALGMALDASLRERAVAHHDDKQQLNSVAEDAMRAAKSHEASARGTARHRTLERHDLDLPIIATDENKALRAAYNHALDAAGFTVVTDYVERIVIYPELRLAGRYDRIVKRRRDGKLLIADIKTGSSAVDYPHSTAIQLALYANAPLQAGPLPPEGGETEMFEPLPKRLDKTTGVIIHAVTDTDVEIVTVELAHAWKIAQHAVFPIIEWRARKDLIQPLGGVTAHALDTLIPERTTWIERRLDACRASEEAKQLVVNRWPEHVARPKQPGRQWSTSDLDDLDRMLGSVERDASLTFPIADPINADVTTA